MTPTPSPLDPVSRYRREDGRLFVDLRLHTTRQLFDARDPSPFRDRDLDDDAVEYLVAAFEEIPAHLKTVISICFDEEPTPHRLEADEIVQSIRMHFDYEIDRTRRQMRRLFRLAELATVVAVLTLAACIALASALERFGDGAAIKLLREGLVILGWVALWRPLETALYDWWPHAARQRTLRRVARSEIEVRFGEA